MTSPPLDSTHGRQCQAWHASPPLDSTHGRTTSGVAQYHLLWTAHKVERCWAWHDITAFGQHPRSNNVGRDMPSPPLESTHSPTTSGLACHHPRWTARTVGRCHASHDITALGQNTRSDDVGRGMPSPPLDSTYGWTASGVKYHHRLGEAHTVKRRQA